MTLLNSNNGEGTPYQVIYDAFLAKVENDDWVYEADISTIWKDWNSIMESALPFFKFPRVSLERNETGFVNKLGSQEIQLIANLMKKEWISRLISSWENIKTFYDEKDFSPANFLDKLNDVLAAQSAECDKLQNIYYRSIEDENNIRRPYNFKKFAGGEYL